MYGGYPRVPTSLHCLLYSHIISSFLLQPLWHFAFVAFSLCGIAFVASAFVASSLCGISSPSWPLFFFLRDHKIAILHPLQLEYVVPEPTHNEISDRGIGGLIVLVDSTTYIVHEVEVAVGGAGRSVRSLRADLRWSSSFHH